MDKNCLQDVIIDLKSKRDALSLAHESLKKENDEWNKAVIVLSLVNGLIETTKIKLNWNDNGSALLPIFISSIIACFSALIKFKNFPAQMESIIQSESMITGVLTKMRSHDTLSEDMKSEYIDALEKLEVAIYPDVRQKFLRQSHKNLLAIMKQDKKYFNEIQEIRSDEYVPSDTSSEEDLKKNFSVYKREMTIDRSSQVPESPNVELKPIRHLDKVIVLETPEELEKSEELEKPGKQELLEKSDVENYILPITDNVSIKKDLSEVL